MCHLAKQITDAVLQTDDVVGEERHRRVSRAIGR
jgi:hypothetical protein